MTEKKLSIVDNFVNMMEKDSRGFQIFLYGVSGIGLLTAMYKIRPFAKFSNPLKVPKLFMKNQTILRGTVSRIEPGNTVILMVDHKPVLFLPRFGEPKYLPLKIAGVDVTNHGISWLSTIVQGNKIEFVPVRKTKDFLECTVVMLREKQEPLAVGKELVALGFGIVKELPPVSGSKLISSYNESLLSAQSRAKLKRNGQWHFTIYPTIWWRIRNAIDEKLSLRT